MPNSTDVQRPNRHLAHLSPFTDSSMVFLTVTLHNRRRVLDCSTAHEVLRGLWDRSATHDGWFVGDYLLMPDHVHFFARAALESRSMSEWVQMWKSVSSRQFIKTLGLKAPVWQEDYFDRYLRNGESYADKWLYVEQNPVRAGLVGSPEEWPYKGRIHELRM